MKKLIILFFSLLLSVSSAQAFVGSPIEGGGSSGTGSVATDTLWDAAGDLAYGTGANTAGRLAAGTAYQILMMNAGATAPAWTSTLGVTGTRLTKGWFTDLVVTNPIESGTAGATAGGLTLYNATSGSIALAPATGALGTTAITVPATSGTMAVLASGACAAAGCQGFDGTDKYTFFGANSEDFYIRAGSASNVNNIGSTTSAILQFDQAVNLLSSDADPATTSGQIKVDSSDTNASSGSTLKFGTANHVATVIHSGADDDYVIIVKTEYIPVAYMEDGASAPSAAAVLASTRKVKIRDFRGGTGDQDVEIHWMVPDDYVGGIKFRPIMFVSNATAPAENETIIFSLAGCSLGTSDVLGCTAGTAATSTYTADATLVQYDRIAGPYSSAITVTNAVAGESAMLKLFRDQANDTYGQVIGLAGIEIKYQAKIMLNSTY